MADLPLILQPHTVQIETRTGVSGSGPVFAAARSIRCRMEGMSSISIDSNGQKRLSGLTLFANLNREQLLKLGSKVTWRGATGTISQVIICDDGGAGAWNHIQAQIV